MKLSSAMVTRTEIAPPAFDRVTKGRFPETKTTRPHWSAHSATFNSLSCLDNRGFGAVKSALITLLPKSPRAEEVKDFRPVNLIHGVAKWVAKVIANRLAPLLPQLVGSHQSAFVRGRCLLDNFMMVQGRAHKLHSSKHPTIMLKLDITKAFDMVDWSFFLRSLGR
jgi:hypothetical protein